MCFQKIVHTAKSKMAIDWTPWNVPMHRRLEVCSAAFAMFMALAVGPLTVLIMLYFVVSFLLDFDNSANIFVSISVLWKLFY